MTAFTCIGTALNVYRCFKAVKLHRMRGVRFDDSFMFFMLRESLLTVPCWEKSISRFRQVCCISGELRAYSGGRFYWFVWYQWGLFADLHVRSFTLCAYFVYPSKVLIELHIHLGAAGKKKKMSWILSFNWLIVRAASWTDFSMH